ncbi:MAG: glycoside hydrolase family 27 protein [Bacteroidetes bacterium]|nr:glycoside hydrolase family 27 protein [Bacteroidota bacterium]
MPRLTTLCLIILIGCSAVAQKYPNLAPTPPMGWNSWNIFHCDIDEWKVKAMADAMAANGMKDAGYQYVVIDDCWQVARDKDGYVIADSARFPSGIKALADYIHSKGLKFGIYSCGGRLTCQRRPGGAGYEVKDAQRYAEWGVDYLKYDWCNSDGLTSQVQYSTMRDALHRAGRPIVFSLCEWGSTKPWLWADTVGHLWRTTGDIRPRFLKHHGVLALFDAQAKIRKYNKPNAWNDPDMLEVGNEGLTLTESRTHFTLWCMMAAPLMSGNDLRAMQPDVLKILSNKHAIGVDQDKLGVQCFLWKNQNGVEVWVKPLTDQSYAICFLNRSNKTKSLDFDAKGVFTDPDFQKTYSIDSNYAVYDIWGDKTLSYPLENIKAKIAPHDALFVLMDKVVQVMIKE